MQFILKAWSFIKNSLHHRLQNHINWSSSLFLLSTLNMFLFAGVFSKATTLWNCEKWLYLNIRIFKVMYGAVAIPLFSVLFIARSSRPEVFRKKGFLEISQNS